MDKEKVYILQKDLPDYKAGEEFTFDGMYYKAKNPCEDGVHGQWPEKYVEDNPTWFKLKEEVNTVISFNTKGNEIIFWLTGCNMHISRERLAELLINYTKYKTTHNVDMNGRPFVVFMFNGEEIKIDTSRLREILIAESTNEKKYTEKEYLQFGEECFNAGREPFKSLYGKYESFSDYMNRKNK